MNPRKHTSLRADLFTIAAGILFIIAGCIALKAFGDPPPIGWTTPAEIVRVIDGDTIEVEIRRRVTVRLLDCWCPESRTTDAHEKQLGLASKANLERISRGQPLTLHVPADRGEDLSSVFTFGRVVGTVWTADKPDRSINQRQIDAGHAWPTKAQQKAAVEASRPAPVNREAPPSAASDSRQNPRGPERSAMRRGYPREAPPSATSPSPNAPPPPPRKALP